MPLPTVSPQQPQALPSQTKNSSITHQKNPTQNKKTHLPQKKKSTFSLFQYNPEMGIDYKREESNNNMHTLVFTYGTLKRGFSNHVLMQDLIRTGDASFRGTHKTMEAYPLVCGPYRVPLLLNLPGESGAQRVTGELYAVTLRGLERLDELEGTVKGHYERLPIRLKDKENAAEEVVEAEAYFGHRSYAGDMWRSSGKRGYGVYGEKEAKGYVKRKDRPQGLTFLQQIQVFMSSQVVN